MDEETERESAAELVRLEVTLAAVAHERDVSQGAARVAEARISESTAALDEAGAERDALAAELDRERDRSAQTARELDEQRASAGVLRSDLEGARARSEDLELRAEAGEARAKAQEDRAAAGEARAEASEVRARASDARAEESEARMRASDDRAAASEARTLASEVRARASDARAEESEARMRASDVRAEASETRARASDARAEASTTRAEASEARARASEAQAKASDERSAASSARAKASEARADAERRRADRLERSLKALRAGRSYRLMRVLWRLNGPFRRSREQGPSAPAESDSPPAPPVVPAPLRVPSRPRAGTQAPPGERLVVAAILDEMSTACFAPECDLVSLTQSEWADQLDESSPDLLLVESAWHGNGGEWQYQIAKYSRKDLVGHPKLRALVDACRERGIPTAFWNKEDPIHFERFAEAAALFDHVFTTDARCVERYERLPGVRTVTPLPFAAQPTIHNPRAVVDSRSSSPCFAGAWYRDRHEDRRRSLEEVLDAARPFGLVIYDRTFGTEDPAFGFPDRFQPHVLGKLPYERILDVYKSHDVFLNANSVVDSPTMCSRRVFELAACDTAILSTPGSALSALLGEAVLEADDVETATAALVDLSSDEARRSRTRAARRAVFASHTYADRLSTIAKVAGLDAPSPNGVPFAVPGTPAEASNDAPWVLELLPGVELSVATLADMRDATRFADAQVIGTHPARNGDRAIEHRRVSTLDPRAVLVRRDLLRERGWPSDGDADDVRSSLRRWSDDGVRVYAGDADWLAERGR